MMRMTLSVSFIIISIWLAGAAKACPPRYHQPIQVIQPRLSVPTAAQEAAGQGPAIIVIQQR